MPDKKKLRLKYEFIRSIEMLRLRIRACEGIHFQQVVYSTHHDGVTQICFGCKKIRSTIYVR